MIAGAREERVVTVISDERLVFLQLIGSLEVR